MSIDRITNVDLILWEGSAGGPTPAWPLGAMHRAPYDPASAYEVTRRCLQGNARYLLFWDPSLGLPDPDLALRLAPGADVIHAGLRVGTRGLPEELDYMLGEWSLLDPDDTVRATSWRVSLRCCLAATAVLQRLGQIDPAFVSLDMAGLEAGFRWLRRGAIVWYDPRLVGESVPSRRPSLSLPVSDRYLFVRRTYKETWSRYAFSRRCLATTRLLRELAGFRAARAEPAPRAPARAIWEWPECEAREAKLADAQVSVLIPTIGRYPYLPEALDSLRRQTVRPLEVICVDQNPADQRQPELYRRFEDLNLQVLWLDERGQSLSRNAGLAQTRGDYLFLFEDDGAAAPDALEQHLRVLLRYGADVSTGVCYPPPPKPYELPQAFSFVRVAQTFASGNAVLTRRALEAVGGFDRRYDRGVNADLDIGTRLYLSGALILHNPRARMVHYKAPTGGLRTYGAWWANSTVGLFQPFPAPTQLYYTLRFLTPRQRRERALMLVATALLAREARSANVSPGDRRRAVARAAGLLVLLPVRLTRAQVAARRLLEAGPSIPSAEPLCLPSPHRPGGAPERMGAARREALR